MLNADESVQLAHAHHLAGRRGEAEGLCRAVLEREPEHAGALHVLAVMARVQGRPAVAARLAAMAVAAAPAVAGFRNTLGVALGSLGRLDEAAAAFREALRLRPDSADAWRNLGTALARAGRLAEARDAYERAIACGSPDERGVREDLVTVCNEANVVPGLLAARRRTVALAPDDPRPHSALLYALHYDDRLSRRTIFDEHLAWARRHADPLRAEWRPHDNDRNPDRRLRVGYVSAAFRAHPVARFQEAALRHHDRSEVEVCCYASVPKPDATTERLRALADRWADVSSMSDAELAERIRADRIDVLVDLDGHDHGDRLLCLARRPAPVQVTCNGYIDTTGMAAIDWRITDVWHDQPGATDRVHAERLCRLPGGCWCYTPDDDAPRVSEPPVLRGGGVTFGCLNKLLKVSPRAARAWARVLDAAPGSRLVLVTAGPAATHADVRRGLAAAGLPNDRVTLLERATDRREYLERFGDIDISLDPFPFNGITTTCDSLWMGVPVVSLAGDSFASRAGVSLLTAAGVPKLVARDETDYVHLATSLASDPARLATLRAGLRGRIAESPLCDGPGFARRLEAAYRSMWRQRCESPAAFEPSAHGPGGAALLTNGIPNRGAPRSARRTAS